MQTNQGRPLQLLAVFSLKMEIEVHRLHHRRSYPGLIITVLLVTNKYTDYYDKDHYVIFES